MVLRGRLPGSPAVNCVSCFAHKLRRYPNPLYDYFGSCTSEFHLDDNQSVFVMSHIECTGFSITLSDRAEYLDDRRRWRPFAAMFYASLHSKDT